MCHHRILKLCAKYGGLLAVVALVLLAQPVQAAKEPWCKADTAPQIKISASANTLKYNFRLNEKQLGGFKIDTKSPYAKHVITDVGGLMQGGIEMRQSMRYKSLTNPRYKQTCMWYDSIEVKITFDPTVYIASEFPQGTCRHNAIMQHEMKHVQVDRQMVNKYADLIGKAIKKEIDTKPMYGPVPESQKAAMQQTMNHRMEQIMRSYSNIMDAERSLLQQQIDSIEEYERVDNVCPREPVQQKQTNAQRR